MEYSIPSPRGTGGGFALPRVIGVWGSALSEQEAPRVRPVAG
jgi:hypothetical protein